MSEDETRYQVLPLDPDVVYEPGVRALQAGYEEGQAYKALALALLTEAGYAHILKSIQQFSSTWILKRTIVYQSPLLVKETAAALPQLCAWGLLEYRNTPEGAEYRLTPFGARVADAIKGEG